MESGKKEKEYALCEDPINIHIIHGFLYSQSDREKEGKKNKKKKLKKERGLSGQC